jgi:stage IV sporulation protein FB
VVTGYLYDVLKFKLFGIPAGVHATFLFIALLGATTYRGWDIAMWTGAAFVSILAHEMGHALVARGFGARGVNVTLYGLGGVTTFTHTGTMAQWKSFIISASGSAVGIVLGGAVWFAVRSGAFDGAGHEVTVFINSLFFTSLVWGILNWIPIVPLDGGHMVQHFIAIFSPKKAPLISQIITWIAVVVIVPFAWLNGYRFGVFIVVMFAIAGLREYRQQAAASKPKIVQPSQPQPAPPADPTPPDPPPEFPI